MAWLALFGCLAAVGAIALLWPEPEHVPDRLDDPRGGLNVTALAKGKERWILIYEDGRRCDALKTLGRWATDPELSFTWYDAAVMSKRIREEMEQ